MATTKVDPFDAIAFLAIKGLLSASPIVEMTPTQKIKFLTELKSTAEKYIVHIQEMTRGE
jgi:hypothetical protein